MSGLADSVLARLFQQRELLADLHRQCEGIRVRVSSRDRSVTVEVDGVGTLVSLTLRGSATRMRADTLAELIVNTSQTAAQIAFARRDELTGQLNQRLSELHAAPLRRTDAASG